MELRSEQYERIALRLDGEAVDLTAEELAAAREIQAGEAALQRSLGAPAVPARALARARRQLRAATGRRIAVRARFVGVAAAGVAIAAAIVVAWAIRLHGPPAPPTLPAVPPEVWAQAIAEPPGGEAIQFLSRELDRFEAELAVSKPPSVDWQIDSVQHEIDNFWREEPPVEVPEG